MKDLIPSLSGILKQASNNMDDLSKGVWRSDFQYINVIHFKKSAGRGGFPLMQSLL